MASQAIDLSAGMIPAPTAPAIDLSAGMQPKTTTNVGGQPVDLVTGEGALAAAQSQAQQDTTNQAQQMHGAVSLMGRPASSMAQDQAFDAALQGGSKALQPSFSGPTPDVPAGMEQTAHIAENIPNVARAASSVVPAEAMVSAVGKLLPNAQRAAQALQDVKAAAGSVPIDISDAGNTALEMMTQKERGGQLPQAVRQLVSRFTDPDKPPITYAEAKDFQSNISNLSANEKMALKPNTIRLLGQLNQNLKDALANAADTQGKGEAFVNAMKEYHNAMKIKGMSEAAIEAAWKAGLSAAGVYGAKRIWDAGQ